MRSGPEADEAVALEVLRLTFTRQAPTFGALSALSFSLSAFMTTPWFSVSRSALPLIAIGLLVALGIGCSSSSPPASSGEGETVASTEPGPVLHLLYRTTDDRLMLHNAGRDEARPLVDDAHTTGAQAVSPSGRYLALSYATADSSHLALLDLTARTLQQVHARAGTVTYSLAWHPDQDRLAFGYYRPAEQGTRGPGNIRIATPGASTQSIGCQAAREVLHWLPGGALATRTDDKLYVVAPDDCATQASLDARRMHLIRYAPDGQQMAYIHRELRYDRAAEDYVPDSSLVLSGAQGENAETLFRDRRHPRHARWSPEGTELALDVVVEDSGHRQVVVYNGSRPTFLVPPAETTTDQVQPRWSPSGTRLAFTLRRDAGLRAAVRVKGQTRQLAPVDGAVWGWLDERSVVVPGPDSVRIQSLNGQTRFSHPAPATLLYVWRAPFSEPA